MTRVCVGRRGMTLLELLIVLALVGILAGVAAMAARRVAPIDHSDPLVMVEDSLRRAVAEARAITVDVVKDGKPVSATANPDGSVVADSTFGIDRFAGTATHAR